MEQKKRYGLLAVILVVVLLLAGVGYRVLSERYTAEVRPEAATQSSQEQEKTEAEPMYAPDFTVLDSEGKELHFSDLAGKPAILNFWATWCPYCKTELPAFDQASQTYGEDIHFMMIDLCDRQRDTPESGAAFLEKEGYSFPAYYDTTGSAVSAYQVFSIPLTVGINREGEIVALYNSPVSEEQLEQMITYLLS